MTTAASGVLQRRVMHFPRPVPTEQWVKDRLMWANSIGSLCPDGGLDPVTDQQDDLVTALQEMKEYEPCTLPLSAYGPMVRDLDTALRIPVQDRKRWQDTLDGLPALPPDGAEQATQDSDASRWEETAPGAYRFVYREKLPGPVVQRLIALGVLSERPDGHLAVSSPEEAEALFSVAAKYARSEDQPKAKLLADAQTDEALVVAAAASTRSKGEPAMSLQLPLMFRVRKEVSIAEVLNFRSQGNNDEMRMEYLALLQDVLDRAQTDDATGLRRMVEQDVAKAARSFRQRLDRQSLLAGGLTTVGVIIPVAAPSVEGIIAGGTLAVLASLSPTLVKLSRRSPGYIRAAKKGKLLESS